MKYIPILGFCLVSLFMAQGALAAKIYTWTDSGGVTHFGEHPPKNAKAVLVKARTGHSNPTPPAEPKSEDTKSSATANARADASFRDPERCAVAKKNLETLQGYARIKIKDEQGELRYLTEEEKQKRLTETQAAVSESC